MFDGVNGCITLRRLYRKGMRLEHEGLHLCKTNNNECYHFNKNP